jgi:hypothetical protein
VLVRVAQLGVVVRRLGRKAVLGGAVRSSLGARFPGAILRSVAGMLALWV